MPELAVSGLLSTRVTTPKSDLTRIVWPLAVLYVALELVGGPSSEPVRVTPGMIR